MKRGAQLLTRFYSRLLALYPRRYRGEYGEELRAVFSMAAGEAAEEGLISLLLFGLHELRDLPLAVLHQHRKEKSRSKMGSNDGELIAFKPASWREIMLAAAPFLYFGMVFYVATNTSLPADGLSWIRDVAAFGMLSLLILLLLVGLVKGFPLWSLPPIGLLLTLLLFINFVSWSSVLPILIPIKSWYPVWLRDFIRTIRFQADVLRAVLFVLIMAAVLIRLTPFYQRLKQDWTRLSFTLYGVSLFMLVLIFDEYQNEAPYVLIASMFLAAGAFFYLKCGRSWQRMLALLAGLTLAMVVVAVGKAILVSSPNWPWPRHQPSWQREVMSTIYFWLYLLMLIFIPALVLRLLFFTRKRLNFSLG